MRAAVVAMTLVAVLAFPSDRAHGQPNPFQQQQPRRGLDNLLDDNQGIAGPAQAVVPAANQLDVPAEAELKDADKQIKTAYEADYKGNPKLLAEKLNAAAYETKEEDDPASKYVLLLESQEAFMRAGDVDNAVQLLNFRGGLFKINMPVEKLKLIKEFPKPIGAIGKKLIDLSLKMTDEALEADQVEIAENAIDLALALARKSAGPGGLKTCAIERTRVKERRVAFDECQTALAVLAKNPADQVANSVVGRYYSTDKHDWEKGLPYLIQGKQDSLKDYATREQTLRQNKVPADNTIEQMFLLAGDWWTLSEDTKGKDKKLATGIETHARDLYAELQPNLTRPVDKELARTRAAGGRNMGGKKPDNGRNKLRILVISGNKTEQEAAVRASQKYKMRLEGKNSFADAIQSLNEYDVVVCCANALDYWGGNEDRKQPAAFKPVDEFIARGGHCVIFGTWNGRNMEHLTRYGISTGYQHTSFFKPVKGVTEVFLAGTEDLVPADKRLQSTGNFKCASPHTVLLDRDDGRGPAMITLPYEKGRLTFSQVEPHWPEDKPSLWIIGATFSWVMRGVPTK